jgi:hypothetical protein
MAAGSELIRPDCEPVSLRSRRPWQPRRERADFGPMKTAQARGVLHNGQILVTASVGEIFIDGGTGTTVARCSRSRSIAYTTARNLAQQAQCDLRFALEVSCRRRKCGPVAQSGSSLPDVGSQNAFGDRAERFRSRACRGINDIFPQKKRLRWGPLLLYFIVAFSGAGQPLPIIN